MSINEAATLSGMTGTIEGHYYYYNHIYWIGEGAIIR
jgi:hypothetical protein